MGLDGAHVKTLDLDKLRVRIVPTLVLVDRSGKILYSHEGTVPQDKVDATFQTVQALMNEAH